MITKRQLLTKYTQVQIAGLFGITKGAVHQWDSDAPIDLRYEYILRHDKDPDLWRKFNKESLKTQQKEAS